MAEQVEAHHQHDRIEHQPPIRVERLPKARLADLLRFGEGGRFGHAGADEQDQEGGQNAEQEHAAPTDGVIAEGAPVEQPVGDRGEQEAGGITALQDAGDDAARLRRNQFHRQRTAEAPFAAHRDAEQRAQRQEHPQARREGGERADHGIAGDVEHQRRLAPPLVADLAEDEGADEAHRQGEEQSVGDLRHPDAELLGDVLEQEGQKKEIEGVERPSEK